MGPIDFGKAIEKSLLEATSPFVLSTVSERSFLRFLDLVAYDNGKIGAYIKMVDDRNDSAHHQGNILFSTQAALAAKITENLSEVDEIQEHSRPVIERCYRELLMHSADPEVREFPDSADQTREVLMHGNYMSQRDIGLCLGFGIDGFKEHGGIGEIRALHETLTREYETEVRSVAPSPVLLRMIRAKPASAPEPGADPNTTQQRV